MNKMFRYGFGFGIIFAATFAPLRSHCQGVTTLHAGDTWTYHFSSLDHVSTDLGPASPFTTHFDFTYNGSGGMGDSLVCRLFEDESSSSPFWSTTQPIGLMGPYMTGHEWQDLNGAVQFAVSSGEFTITSLTLVVWQQHVISDDPFYGTQIDTYHTTITSVPEPGVSRLCALGLTCLLVIFWREQRRGQRRIT
jgi:hypothetical protein